jgi:hypothetical protein
VTGVPGLTIYVPLEGAPRLWLDALTNTEEARLWDWIATHPPLLELIAQALAIAEEAKAA